MGPRLFFMSNTPNPKRRPKPIVRHQIEMAPIWRDDAGNVHIPGGYLSGARYEEIRQGSPQLALPELEALPVK